MQIVMYHYVRVFDETRPYLHFLDIEDFSKQLDYFEENFGLVTKQEFDMLLNREIDLSDLDGKVLLTFDDALSCHYDFVYTELKSREAFGVFFVSTKPFKSSVLLDVHKIHFLTSKYTSESLLQIIDIAKKYKYFDSLAWDKHKSNVYQKQQNFNGVHELKFMLNYCIPSNMRGELLDFIANENHIRWEVEGFYLSIEQLKEMHEFGMAIGSHTHSHPLMASLPFDEQVNEIQESVEILSNIIDSDVKLYCHPYGGELSYNEDTLKALDVSKISYGFDVNPRSVTEEDMAERRFVIPRYDCNLFLHGKSYLSR